MRLSRQCEIAVDILIFCAQRPDEIVKIRAAAAFAQATANHAHQISLRLVRSGFLDSLRGKNGGIRLARQAGRIGVGDVVRAMHPKPAPTERQIRNDGFRALAAEAAQAAFATFDAFTIADLAGHAPGNRLACLTCAIRTSFRASPRLRAHRIFPTVTA